MGNGQPTMAIHPQRHRFHCCFKCSSSAILLAVTFNENDVCTAAPTFNGFGSQSNFRNPQNAQHRAPEDEDLRHGLEQRLGRLHVLFEAPVAGQDGAVAQVLLTEQQRQRVAQDFHPHDVPLCTKTDIRLSLSLFGIRAVQGRRGREN